MVITMAGKINAYENSLGKLKAGELKYKYTFNNI